MEKLPSIGTKKTFIPEAFHCGLTVECDRHVTGEVIWIHPRGNFYVVRIEVHGHVWHECFMPGE